ncbi:MAG: NACHT domain-containing protein [Pseudanabaena sp. ELA607]
MNQFGKFAEKIGILVQGGTVNVGQLRLDSEMSRQELRNRKALLNNVRTAWVEGVLEKSLHEQIPIVLGLEKRPSAVASPWNLDLINPDKSCQPLPAGTPVIDVFDKLGEGGTLLILGEPGSGKTITLLQLARDLIARAEEEIDRRIPVVLNLSSWAAEKQTIAIWIVEELNSKYQVNRKIGQQWVEKQELLLLLDGLDEIRDLEKRNACVTALNAFQQDQATEMVVCCRMNDYEQLGERLKLQSALVLQPLTTDQIRAYLDLLQSNLTVLKALLIEDMTLQELAHSPLLLNMMVLAYQGIEVADIPVSTIASNRKKQLFDDYINRIFQGSRLAAYHPNSQSQEKHYYSRQATTVWLRWVAKKMIRYSQTIFLIENIQFTWLEGSDIFFLKVILLGEVKHLNKSKLLKKNIRRILSVNLIQILQKKYKYQSLRASLWHIKPVESIMFSWERFRYKLTQSWISNLFAYIFVTSFFMIFGGTNENHRFVILSILLGLAYLPTIGLVISEVESKLYPNQGIRKSAINFIVVWLISGVLIGLAMALGFFPISSNKIKIFGVLIFEFLANVILGVLIGLIMGLYFAADYGGRAFIQHFILRLILYFTGRIPWNYGKFLDWASDKLFLQKVGGGYIFIHRSLMEHFAEMENG